MANSVSSPVSARPRWGRYAVWLAALAWFGLMAPLARWGLPSRQADELLFGGAPPWSADRYHTAAALQVRQERSGGADTDLDPLTQRDRIVDLTATAAARADILRRYRLFSRQPDEMITFMALQRMRPRQFDFDPRLYQYGGAFIYLVGTAIGASATLGITHLSSDPALYLEQPEEFARFYLAARLVTLAFGALLLVAVWKLADRLAGTLAAWVATLLLACTPVFISGVLEAKPHVPSACMILWAALAALDYYDRGRRRDAVRLGLFAGCGFGLVLTGIVAAAIWPALLIARRRALASEAGRSPAGSLLRHLALGAGIALAVYVLTNPYIPYNYLFNRAALASNIENSTAMYAGQIRQAGAGAVRVGELLLESAGPGLLLTGLAGLLWLARRQPRQLATTASSGAAMLLIAVLLGAHKPAEYARFLILPVSIFAIGAGVAIGALAGVVRAVRSADVARCAPWRRPLALVVTVVVVATMKTPIYIRSFIDDAAGQDESRRRAAELLSELTAAGEPIAVIQEPAPYAVPPLDFAHRQILWLPPVRPAEIDPQSLPPWLVFTTDDATDYQDAWWRQYYRPAAEIPSQPRGYSRITWANKPVFILQKK